MKFALITLLFIFSTFNAAYAQQETHGGDGFAMEFYRTYSELRAQFPNSEIELPDGRKFSVAALDAIRPKLKVQSLPQVFWNGKEVSARNTPATFLVEISQSHWVRMNYEQKASLVLHEVLPIAGWMDADYLVSAALLKQIDLKRASLALHDLFDALLSCNTSLLQNISKGLYQSFLPSVRADLIHGAIMSGCEYFLRTAVDSSSLAEVQSTCDSDSDQTPFEALLISAVGFSRWKTDRIEKIFDFLYPQMGDAPLTCRMQDAVKPRGHVCEILSKYQDSESALVQALERKANCRL